MSTTYYFALYVHQLPARRRRRAYLLDLVLAYPPTVAPFVPPVIQGEAGEFGAREGEGPTAFELEALTAPWIGPFPDFEMRTTTGPVGERVGGEDVAIGVQHLHQVLALDAVQDVVVVEGAVVAYDDGIVVGRPGGEGAVARQGGAVGPRDLYGKAGAGGETAAADLHGSAGIVVRLVGADLVGGCISAEGRTGALGGGTGAVWSISPQRHHHRHRANGNDQ